MYVTEAAFVADLELFDAVFFGMGPAEAASVAPEQRALLPVAYAALHRAGYSTDTMRDAAIAVYVGHSGAV